MYNLYGNFGKYEAYSGIGGVKLNTPRTILDLLHIPKFVSPYASFRRAASTSKRNTSTFSPRMAAS